MGCEVKDEGDKDVQYEGVVQDVVEEEREDLQDMEEWTLRSSSEGIVTTYKKAANKVKMAVPMKLEKAGKDRANEQMK